MRLATANGSREFREFRHVAPICWQFNLLRPRSVRACRFRQIERQRRRFDWLHSCGSICAENLEGTMRKSIRLNGRARDNRLRFGKLKYRHAIVREIVTTAPLQM